ncbi:MAG: hypothetical protein JSV00_08220 [bacterium]|nr:MAG: hypothetical protein JSV00_08220 [bacterium]
MSVVGSDELRGLVRFAVDLGKQTVGDRLTLTLLDVVQIAGEATVGPEPEMVEEARRIKRPARKGSSDAMGAWDLVQGAYLVTYNESVRIPEGCLLFLEAHPLLQENGVWHPTRVLREWDTSLHTLLIVTARGIRLMENSPVSVGLMVRLEDKKP